MRSLNELKARLRLSMDETDYGEATLAILVEIDDEGGAEICTKLKAAFMVPLINLLFKIIGISSFSGFLQQYNGLFGAMDQFIG